MFPDIIMSIMPTVEDLRPHHRSGIDSLADRLFADNPHARGFWKSILEMPANDVAHVHVALENGSVVGVSAVFARPMTYGSSRADNARMVIDIMAPGHDRASAMLQSAAEACLRETGKAYQYQYAPEDNTAFHEELVLRGFRLESTIDYHEFPADVLQVPPVPGVTVSQYDGSDPRLNQELADLCNRTLRRENVWPDAGAEQIRAYTQRNVWFVAIDDKSGRVVGIGETNPKDAVYSFIVVARSHWGTGLADHLASVGWRHLADLDISPVTVIARRTNSASIALQRRMNGKVARSYRYYVKPVPQTAG